MLARGGTNCVRPTCWKMDRRRPADLDETLGFCSVGKDFEARNVVATHANALMPVTEKSEG